jgi:hypothetical protein
MLCQGFVAIIDEVQEQFLKMQGSQNSFGLTGFRIVVMRPPDPKVEAIRA